MKRATHWAQGSAQGTGSSGSPFSISCWRSSELSEDDAREQACAAARRVVELLLSGRKPDRYAYGAAPMREEVIESMSDSGPQPDLQVTRNRYGALVLNTSRVMFVDVDFPESTPPVGLGDFVRGLFGKPAAMPDAEGKCRAVVEAFVAANGDWNVRLYRTAAGLRALVTHDLFDPGADATRATLEAMGCDPLYIKLCRAQACFRARLTPKPWRCGLAAGGCIHPVTEPRAAERLARWKADYESRHPAFSTCRFIANIGSGSVHADAARVIQLHDAVTRCETALPLA